MAHHNFTDTFLRKLKTEKPQEDFYDSSFSAGCLGLRVSKTGRKCFFTRYKKAGKNKRYTLGIYPGLTLKEARDKAIQVRGQLIDGDDPQVKRRAKKTAGGFMELWEAYIKQSRPSGKEFSKNYLVSSKNIIQKDIAPYWSDRQAQTIEPEDVEEILSRLIKRGSPVQADRTWQLLKAVYNYGIKKRHVKSNPVLLVDRPPQAKRRKRFLTLEEIKILWEETAKADVELAIWYRLQLIFGFRPGEPLLIHKDDIDGDTLFLDGDKLKNGRDLELFIPEIAKTQFERIGFKAGYLFPGVREHERRLSFSKQDREFRASSQIKDWTARDLRRTAETQMRKLPGLSGDHISRVLNHDFSVIRKHYDQHTYYQEKKEVLLKWSSHLISVLT